MYVMTLTLAANQPFCRLHSRSNNILLKCGMTILLQALQYGDGERKRDVD